MELNQDKAVGLHGQTILLSVVSTNANAVEVFRNLTLLFNKLNDQIKATEMAQLAEH